MPRPVVIRCRLIPEQFCVNLFGTLWCRKSFPLDKFMVNHEHIHTAQMRELLFVGFYLIYLLEWLLRLIQERNWYKAYKAISFEREAYARMYNLSYLCGRRHYAQWRRTNQ